MVVDGFTLEHFQNGSGVTKMKTTLKIKDPFLYEYNGEMITAKEMRNKIKTSKNANDIWKWKLISSSKLYAGMEE